MTDQQDSNLLAKFEKEVDRLVTSWPRPPWEFPMPLEALRKVLSQAMFDTYMQGYRDGRDVGFAWGLSEGRE